MRMTERMSNINLSSSTTTTITVIKPQRYIAAVMSPAPLAPQHQKPSSPLLLLLLFTAALLFETERNETVD